MKRFLPLLTVAALAAAAPPTADHAVDGKPTDPPARNFAVRCGVLHLGDGATRENCWLIVRDGQVANILQAVGDAAETPPDDLPVVDASDRVVIPGLVAADSDLSGQGDDEYAVTPDLVALDGFDFLRRWGRALESGVTTVYLAPGRNRLIPGQGSVVKLAGDDLVQRVLAEKACLRITLGAEGAGAPSVFEPVVHPTADDPLEPARRQYPSSRLSQLDTLRTLFQDAASAPDGELEGPGSVETRYSPRALKQAIGGTLPLRIAAREAADVRRGLAFAQSLGMTENLVLENPWAIGPIAGTAASMGATAVFRMPIRLGASNPGGENRDDERTRPRPENAALAARAGLPVALCATGGGGVEDLLMVAGLAVRFGLPADKALPAITSVAARALGVDDRVGSLEPGHDADFAILSGDPLAVGTMVEQTWVDGEQVYQRVTESDLLAVKVDRIHTGDGQVVDDGVVLVRDGKIRGIGTDLAVPYGASVIDLRGRGSVMVPGFVDGHSSLGLSGDGTGVPGGAANQKIAEVVRPDDPVLEQALKAGVTTVLTSGRDGGLVSGRVTAIKTGARSREEMVVDPIAGQRFVFDAVGPDAIKPIRDQIEAAKKYVEEWAKYEKALADYEAGKGKKPVEEAPAEPAAADDPLSGTWECEIAISEQFTLNLTLTMKLDGTKVTGTAAISMRGRDAPPQDFTGTFENGELKASLNFRGNDSAMTAKVANDVLNGKVALGGNEVDITGARVAKGGEQPKKKETAAVDDGRPKKPKVNEALEPLRDLLAGDATAIIKVGKAPAIEAVVKYFEDEKLAFALHGADDALDTPEILGEKRPAVLLGPELVVREDGELRNHAAEFVDADVPIVICTGDTAGTAYLPLHAAHAVRYGLDPVAALHAVTIEPAKAFGIDDRVGSLARGKDADFVVFDGGPFEPTSHTLLVVCNGHVAVHAAEEATR